MLIYFESKRWLVIVFFSIWIEAGGACLTPLPITPVDTLRGLSIDVFMKWLLIEPPRDTSGGPGEPVSRGAKSGVTVGYQRAGRVSAGCVSQGAGYAGLSEPLVGTATGHWSSPQPPADLMTFRLSDPGAAE